MITAGHSEFSGPLELLVYLQRLLIDCETGVAAARGWGGGMAQAVQGPEFDSWDPYKNKSSWVWRHAHVLSALGRQTSRSPRFTGYQWSLCNVFQASERPCCPPTTATLPHASSRAQRNAYPVSLWGRKTEVSDLKNMVKGAQRVPCTISLWP